MLYLFPVYNIVVRYLHVADEMTTLISLVPSWHHHTYCDVIDYIPHTVLYCTVVIFHLPLQVHFLCFLPHSVLRRPELMEIINTLLYPLTSSWTGWWNGWEKGEVDMFLLPALFQLGHCILGVSSTESYFLSCLYSSSFFILETTPSPSH